MIDHWQHDCCCTKQSHFGLPSVALSSNCKHYRLGRNPAHLLSLIVSRSFFSCDIFHQVHYILMSTSSTPTESKAPEEGYMVMVGFFKVWLTNQHSIRLCFMENWLSDRIPENGGFSKHVVDRNPGRTCKELSEGVCPHLKDQLCHPGHVTAKDRVCDLNTEFPTKLFAQGVVYISNNNNNYKSNNKKNNCASL